MTTPWPRYTDDGSRCGHPVDYGRGVQGECLLWSLYSDGKCYHHSSSPEATAKRGSVIHRQPVERRQVGFMPVSADEVAALPLRQAIQLRLAADACSHLRVVASVTMTC